MPTSNPAATAATAETPNELLVHATAVARRGICMLLRGPSGAGKSDLALRLLAQPTSASLPTGEFALVSDDRVVLRRSGAELIASAPASITGKMEVRGIGIVEVATVAEARVVLVIDLVGEVDGAGGGAKSSTLHQGSVPEHAAGLASRAPRWLAGSLSRISDLPRIPEPGSFSFLGVDLPLLRLGAFEASAPVKVALALAAADRGALWDLSGQAAAPH